MCNVQVNINQYDPTRTTVLRNAFVRDLGRRFNAVIRLIFEYYDNPLNVNYEWLRSGEKVQEFNRWLDIQVQNNILEIRQFQQIGSSIEQSWMNLYITDSYQRGVQRARYELNKAGYNVGEYSINQPFHIERIGLLYSRVFEEMRGLTEQMKTQLSRVLAQGMADGDNPRVIARKLRKAIDGKGDLAITDTLGRFIPAKRRAEIIARTEIIRAHHQATVQEYKNWGVAGVKVKAEWKTAEDGRVCERCKEREGKEYTLKEIENLIPLHPQCRCIALPL